MNKQEVLDSMVFEVNMASMILAKIAEMRENKV